ncbi:hypothetical protein [Ornithinicoccus halotolerans]|uniref:hypothetical protein n=1 Tax=Ornithinicoccus halotolerans TaxID=1748220 RepID=UPI001297F1C2|nr:hypothetical protein [Ornithinicoccus halotolerans]
MRTADDLRRLLATAAAEAPPMHLEPDAVIAAAQARRRRTMWRAVGTLGAAAVLVTALVLGLTGPLGELRSSTEPASVPEWDTTRDFSAVVETGLSAYDGEELHGPVPALEVTRSAGAERFTVTDTTNGEQLDGAPAQGLPGSELFAGEDYAVLLIPAPRGVDGRSTEWLFDWSALGNSGVGQTARVVDDGGQTLLVHAMAAATPVPPDAVGEVVWVVDGTIGLASGEEVQQAEVESAGERLVVWRSPGSDLVGTFQDPPSPLMASHFTRYALYRSPVRGEGAEGQVSRLWSFVVLPEGAQQVRAVLDDEVGTVVPFETVPLGPETLAYRLLDGVEVAQSDTGVWDVAWRDASGEPRHLSDLARDAG